MRATHISSTQHPSRPAWTDVFTAIKSLPALPLEENQLKDGSLDSNFTESAQRKAFRSPSFSQAAISMTAKWLRMLLMAWKAFFYCDAGYLKKCKDLVSLAESGRFICAAARQDMSRLISYEQWRHLRKRNIIESDRGVLKQNYFPEYHQAHSMDEIFRHYCFALSAYMFQSRLKAALRLKTRI